MKPLTPELSVVTPMFNEAPGISVFLRELRKVLESLGRSYEVILVDDGSRDDSLSAAKSVRWPELQIVVLASNVGHQRAMEAGLSKASGDYIVTMDSDGQHAPDLVPILVATAIEGHYDVVYMNRSSREEESSGRRIPALAYYRIVRWLTDVPIETSTADFRLMSRQVLDQVTRIRGDHALRLLLPALGFRSTSLAYEARDRIAGDSRYGIRRQLRLASDSVFGVSSKPLRLMAGMGWLVSLVAFVWLVSVLVTWARQGSVAGWASVMSAVLVIGGMTLLSLSLIGSYLARIHDVVRGYPRWVISETLPGMTDEN